MCVPDTDVAGYSSAVEDTSVGHNVYIYIYVYIKMNIKNKFIKSEITYTHKKISLDLLSPHKPSS